LLRLYRSLGHGVLAIWRLGSRASRAPPVRLGLAVTAAVVLLWISIDTVDRSLAFFFRARDSDFRALFDLTSRLGLTYGYLIVFGLTFVALHWGGSLPRLRFFARPMRAFSAIPAFLFASIAASGLVVDVLKFAFGRPRPKLLFGYGDYGFGGLGMSPDYWSFPSGHAATIAALATALWFVWPQHVLFYILVAAIVSLSRVAAGAHYLSDVFAGAMVAALTTWAVAWLFSKSGIDLAAARRGRGHSAGRPPWPCGRFGRAPFSGGHIGSQQAGSVDRVDHQACNIGPKADCGSRIGSPPWPCASKLSTTSEAETPFTRR
jgi:membrane-associated phospholipid phosphatase